MKILTRKRLLSLLLVVSFFTSFSFLPVHAAETVIELENIVIIGDISQSISDTRGEMDLRNALKPALDLAPNQSEVALLTVDTAIISETDFLPLSVLSNRQEMKKIVNATTFTGGTNLVLGIEKAIEKLEDGPGRIIMLADISDHALTRSTNFSEMTTRAEEASGKAKANGIIIDLILVGDADTSGRKNTTNLYRQKRNYKT